MKNICSRLAGGHGGLPGYFPDYDIRDSWNETWEVKYDRKTKKTGNVYIEHKALRHSTADYIVYYIKLNENQGIFYKIERPTLIAALKRNNITKRWRNVLGGDFHEPGTLIPLEDFYKVFKRA